MDLLDKLECAAFIVVSLVVLVGTTAIASGIAVFQPVGFIGGVITAFLISYVISLANDE